MSQPTQSFTAKDAEDTKERKSFTAKDAKGNYFSETGPPPSASCMNFHLSGETLDAQRRREGPPRVAYKKAFDNMGVDIPKVVSSCRALRPSSFSFARDVVENEWRLTGRSG